MEIKKSIVFLASQPLSKRNFKRFGIEFLSKKWSVYYVDCNYIFRKNYQKSLLGQDEVTYSKYKAVKTKEELYNYLKKVNPSFAINILGDTISEKSLLIKIKKNISIVNLNLGSYPNYKHSKFDKFVKIYNESSILIFLKKIFTIIYLILNKKLKNIKYDYEIISGAKSITDLKYGKIIRAHSFDYDLYLKNKDKLKKINKSTKEKLIVFIDNGSAFKKGDDPLFRDANLGLEYENYFKYVNFLLTYYSDKYSCKIIICTHPKSNLSNLQKKFKFKVCKNNTMEMIYRSDYVISYSSTAIQFAVMFKKPLIFYNYFGNLSNAHKRFYYLETKAFVNSLGRQHIILDNDMHKLPKLNFTIDHYLYNSYFNNYIKENNNQKELWDIIESGLTKV